MGFSYLNAHFFTILSNFLPKKIQLIKKSRIFAGIYFQYP